MRACLIAWNISVILQKIIQINILILIISCSIGWSCRRCWLHHYRGVRLPQQVYLLAIMLQDRILVTEQSLTQQPKWSSDLQYWARWLIRAAWSDQSASHSKPGHRYDYPDYILQVVLVANKYPTLFYF